MTIGACTYTAYRGMSINHPYGDGMLFFAAFTPFAYLLIVFQVMSSMSFIAYSPIVYSFTSVVLASIISGIIISMFLGFLFAAIFNLSEMLFSFVSKIYRHNLESCSR